MAAKFVHGYTRQLQFSIYCMIGLETVQRPVSFCGRRQQECMIELMKISTKECILTMTNDLYLHTLENTTFCVRIDR